MSIFDRVSTINSARTISDIQTLLRRCNISCIRCLDSKKLWTVGKNGMFDLVSCIECGDGRRIRSFPYKPSQDENGHAIFNKLDRNLKDRVDELNKLLTDIDSMKKAWEKQEKETRKTITNENDGKQSTSPEDIDIDLNNPEPKWHRNDEVEREYSKDTPFDEIIEDILSFENLKVDESINLKEILLPKLKKPMQTVRKDKDLFILIKVSYKKPSKGFKGLFCCCTGLMDDIRCVKIRIMKPKNVAAFEECHSHQQTFNRQISMLLPVDLEEEEQHIEEQNEDEQNVEEQNSK